MMALPVIGKDEPQTAVERFAAIHDGGLARERGAYVSLMPASPPGPGQQYAFEVDLDACSGCKACVVACHNRNGLDEGETWRQVGLLLGERDDGPYWQHVTAACHHCLEPSCMDGCPVDAYEKDPRTGIVRHLDDVCIGCQYCTLTCPYEVPQYNPRRGIVRKCDMCADRLASGQPPACAASCPQQAIRIRIVDEADAVQAAESGSFLPTAPDPRMTIPATVYTSRRPYPRTVRPADHKQPRMQHAHWSLIVMLVLTQLSVGMFWLGALGEFAWSGGSPEAADASEMTSRSFVGAAAGQAAFGLESPTAGSASAATVEADHCDTPGATAASRRFAWLCGTVALLASVFHLGRPLRAYRAVRGVRHSWLSREIVAFGVFAVCSTAYAMGPIPGFAVASPVLRDAILASGLTGVMCSVLIYHRTRRALWRWPRTAWRFVGTAVVLGAAAHLLADALVARGPEDWRAVRSTATLLAVAAPIKIAGELTLLGHLRDRRDSELKASARLLVGPLSRLLWARLALGFLGGLWFPLLMLPSRAGAATTASPAIVVLCSIAGFACTLLGEGLERVLFFCAVSNRRMPGIVRT